MRFQSIASRRRSLKLLLSAPLLLLSRGAAHGSTGSPQAPSATQTTRPGRIFSSDAGMIFNSVKPDKTADFEMVISRVKMALQQSADPQRKQQAEGWHVYKVLEPGANDTVMYLFWVNPPVKGADYTVSTILSEAFPTEVQDLYKKFSDAYATGQQLVNLQLVTTMQPQA